MEQGAPSAARIIARVLLPHDELGVGMPVVLLHAGVADRRMWAEHLAAMARAGHRVLAMDLPGFGEAAVAPEQAPWINVLETLDVLNVDRAALVGNALGAPSPCRRGHLPRARHGPRAGIGTRSEFEPSTGLQAAWDREESALERGDIEAAVDAVVEAWTRPDAPAALHDRVATMHAEPSRCKRRQGRRARCPIRSTSLRWPSRGWRFRRSWPLANSTRQISTLRLTRWHSCCDPHATPSSPEQATSRRSSSPTRSSRYSSTSCAHQARSTRPRGHGTNEMFVSTVAQLERAGERVPYRGD
jgi:pimeloyl-ACP methyl ester carboxylesterase